jgi:hypothetical protein
LVGVVPLTSWFQRLGGRGGSGKHGLIPYE